MEKIYLSYQVKMMMPGDMYKVMDTLFGFQKEGCITYSKRNCEFLHLDQAIVEQAIQTAINYKIIEPLEMNGGVYKFKINQATIEASKLIQLNGIPNKPLFKLAEEIKFKQTMGRKEQTNEEILEEIRRLKAQLMSRVRENNETNDLPW